MYVTFNQLPPEARVWIYQANRPLVEAELAAVQSTLAHFAAEWTSHGRTLHAAAEFRHQQFLVIGLDEGVAGASGCSIDASVRFVAQLEQQLGLELLEKSQRAFLQAGTVHLLQRSGLKNAVASGALGPDTLYFDNTLATKKELDTRWPQPASQTWLTRYFGQEEKNRQPA